MRRYIPLALLFAFVVVACTPLPTVPAPDPKFASQQLAAADLKFQKFLIRARMYTGQPLCSATLVVGCADKAVADELERAIRIGDKALDLAHAAYRDGLDFTLQLAEIGRVTVNKALNAWLLRRQRGRRS